ncbi:MAG: histone deacetylase family protein [Verrucomicrobia bacterium]|nr:histone deacetylase family protein [Verrucomicrobiota bacterium]
MKIITDERCTAYSAPGHPERPARVRKTLEKLRAQTDLALTWSEPLPVEAEMIVRAHSKEHIDRVKAAAHDFDGDTPGHPGIFDHAVRSIGGGLQALKTARQGEQTFSLLRPPGHHATRDRAMGFCYLSTVAITALEALATGTANIAVYDFDVHHGNGTEAILLDHPHAAFYSIHQHPCYPGTGTKNVGRNCFNYPVPPRTPRLEYRKVLAQALDDLKKFKPDLVAVSAGFDAYARDPIAQETLEAEDFYWLGQSIRKLEIPAFSLLEGGYSSDLPDLILAYLKGLEGK